MTVREALTSLSVEDKDRIMKAFDHCENCIIFLPDNVFVGVNVTPIQSLNVTETLGVWCLGKHKVQKDETTSLV